MGMGGDWKGQKRFERRNKMQIKATWCSPDPLPLFSAIGTNAYQNPVIVTHSSVTWVAIGCSHLRSFWVILKHNDLKSDWLALGRTADCQVPSAFNEPGKIFLREMLTQTDQFTESKAEAQTSPGVAGCMQSDNAGLVSIAAWWIWPHQLLPKMIPPQRWRDTDISVHNFLRPAAPYVC